MPKRSTFKVFKKKIFTGSLVLEANGHRIRVWYLWDQRNCVFRIIRVREVIGPDGGVNEVSGDSDGDQDRDDGGDINAMRFSLGKMGDQGEGSVRV